MTSQEEAKAYVLGIYEKAKIEAKSILQEENGNDLENKFNKLVEYLDVELEKLSYEQYNEMFIGYNKRKLTNAQLIDKLSNILIILVCKSTYLGELNVIIGASLQFYTEDGDCQIFSLFS